MKICHNRLIVIHKISDSLIELYKVWENCKSYVMMINYKSKQTLLKR